MHATDGDVTFYDGPGMHTVKVDRTFGLIRNPLAK